MFIDIVWLYDIEISKKKTKVQYKLAKFIKMIWYGIKKRQKTPTLKSVT